MTWLKDHKVTFVVACSAGAVWCCVQFMRHLGHMFTDFMTGA